MHEAYLLCGVRTPIGKFLGQLSGFSAPDLGARCIHESLIRSGLDPSDVDEVILGNVLSTGVGQAPARQAALKTGLADTVAALTINKVCGSGLKAVMLASQAIRLGDAKFIVAGGMESMSNAPHLVHGIRTGKKFGNLSLEDVLLKDGLECAFGHCHMGIYAETIARRHNISREDQDRYAEESQRRAGIAMKEGRFDAEIVPVTLQPLRSETIVSQDEGPRPETTFDQLARLKPAFQSDGSVTAGNASMISDGAASIIVCDVESAQQSKAPGKAKIIAAHTSGTAPEDVFFASVGAIRGVLEKAGLSVEDIDLFEIN
ncbi:MAG: acetyl-CoA C-acyltransferase [Planctomycetaceae bacterium]|nr:acetyl-CoA C-acyltransferase [Planctomycetaceae bacterium]